MSLLPQPVASSDALVLRTWPTGETSIIASLLTRDCGYVRVIAKSARGPRSVLRPLVQPGRLVNLEFTQVSGRDLQYLRGGSLLLDPLARAESLEKNAYLLAAVELVDRCRPAESREEGLFALCEDFLRMLCCAPAGGEAGLFYSFELALLARHGVAPALESCAACGAPLAAEEGEVLFSPAAGGVICRRCRAAREGEAGRSIDREVWRALRELAARRPDGPAPAPLPRPVERELGILLHRFLGYHLPGYRLPAALDLLRPPAAGPAASGEPAAGEGMSS
jgi:DNA repair protein RecO (recombination protein O)